MGSLLTHPLREGYSKWFGKISVCVSDSAVLHKLDTPGLPYLPWLHSFEVAKRSLTNVFSTTLEAIKKGKKSAKFGFFQSSRLFLHLTKHELYITGCLLFQQSKLETLNMCTSKVLKLTKVS